MINSCYLGLTVRKTTRLSHFFTEKLVSEIEVVETRSYTVMGKNVSFSFELFPGI